MPFEDYTNEKSEIATAALMQRTQDERLVSLSICIYTQTVLFRIFPLAEHILHGADYNRYRTDHMSSV